MGQPEPLRRSLNRSGAFNQASHIYCWWGLQMNEPQKKEDRPLSSDQMLLLRVLRGGPLTAEELCHCRDDGLIIDDGGNWVLSSRGGSLVSPG